MQMSVINYKSQLNEQGDDLSPQIKQKVSLEKQDTKAEQKQMTNTCDFK